MRSMSYYFLFNFGLVVGAPPLMQEINKQMNAVNPISLISEAVTPKLNWSLVFTSKEFPQDNISVRVRIFMKDHLLIWSQWNHWLSSNNGQSVMNKVWLWIVK